METAPIRRSGATVQAAALLLLCCLPVPGEMRIASLNIERKYGPEGVEQVGRQAELRAADILLLQEVLDGSRAHVASDLAVRLGLHVVFEPAFSFSGQFMEGLAILSRYPLRDPAVSRLPHNALLFHTRRRIVLAVTAESPWGPVRIVNTHLDNRINGDAKRKQLAGIWRALGDYTGPCVMGGDFNNANFRWILHVLPIPGAQSLRRVVDRDMERHGFRTPLGGGPGTLHFLGLKLDWIYLRGLRATGSGVTPIAFSDHNSVWVTAGPAR
ncbi:MAG: endonuclease/exonuclease/phosphatase family protein [Acidobacteriota bacterium]